MNENPEGNYAEVSDLNMYYEIRGSGEPLILLHGGVGAIEMFGRSCRCSRKAGGSSPSICRPTGARPTSNARSPTR